jgi:hypothetical protein
MANPWYSYPQDDPGGGYGENVEPLVAHEPLDKQYKKPDTNIRVPDGTPITALLSGKVTDVSDRGKSAGGLSVTVLLKKPINSVATHISYNYLGSAQVRSGDPVQAGQTIGIAGSPTGILFAIALGSDDVWGQGPGFVLNAKGDPLLDPRPVLAAAMKGTLGEPVMFSNELCVAVWNSYFSSIGKPPPLRDTGIFNAWRSQWMDGNYKGCCLSAEYPVTLENGDPGVAQNFAVGTCVWNKKTSSATWL